MFNDFGIKITETEITSNDSELLNSKIENEFYGSHFQAIQGCFFDENNECLYLYPLTAKRDIFSEDFIDSIVYVLYDNERNEFKAHNYGMAVYENLDFEEASVYIDTQSLYYCTKLVLVSQHHIIDIHLPISHQNMEKATSPETFKEFISILEKNHNIDLSRTEIIAVTGSMRESKEEEDVEQISSPIFIRKFQDYLDKHLAKDPSKFQPKLTIDTLTAKVDFDYCLRLREGKLYFEEVKNPGKKTRPLSPPRESNQMLTPQSKEESEVFEEKPREADSLSTLPKNKRQNTKP